jgi:hypothetical protein
MAVNKQNLISLLVDQSTTINQNKIFNSGATSFKTRFQNVKRRKEVRFGLKNSLLIPG